MSDCAQSKIENLSALSAGMMTDDDDDGMMHDGIYIYIHMYEVEVEVEVEVLSAKC